MSFFNVLSDQTNNRSLWCVSWMSFLCSTSTVMALALLPFFVTEVLGASHTKYGVLEGVALFLAFASKVFSGVLSDIFKDRKVLIAIGSFFSILVKVLFALATSFSWIFMARSIDRLSKGIRSSPTEALIADLSPREHRGASYGLRQTLYACGAAFGAVLATVSMYTLDRNYRLIFFLSTIPAALALLVLIFGVKQPSLTQYEVSQNQKSKSLNWKLSDIKLLPPLFWKILTISFILMLARFSEGFVTLHATKSTGWLVEFSPIIIIIMDLTHASVAYTVGKLSDRWNRLTLLLIGLIIFVITTLVFASATNIPTMVIGIILLGLHMGITQGLLCTLIADAIPAHLRGTAFAIYYLSTGTAVLIGNPIAGRLSTDFGTFAPFLGGATFITLSILALLVLMRHERKLAVAV